MDDTPELYQFDDLSTQSSFRLVELLPGEDGDKVTCSLHTVSWADPPDYEGLSYAWGDPHAEQRVICDGKKLNIGQNLHSALLHLRYSDKPRLLWVDCLW